jgi:hypothetical protein
MFSGTVILAAKMPGLQFDHLDVDLVDPGVAKVVLRAQDGRTLHIDVELTGVATEEGGEKLASQAADRVCDRLAYAGCWGISTPVIMSSSFKSLTPPTPGTHEAGVREYLRVNDTVSVIVTPGPVQLTALKTELELPSPPGEHHYGMFRAALSASDPVVRFLQLYHLLNMLFNDKQAKVDAFIVSEDPCVTQTTSPKTGQNEAVYTRLRNELAHKRTGVNLDDTKRQMANHVVGLARLTKRAIELHP